MRPPEQLPLKSPLTILTLLAGLAITLIGLRFILAPHVGAEGYGVAVRSTDADAFLLAKGVRDVASGLFVFCMVATAPRRVVGVFMLAATFIPTADAMIILHSVGPQPGPLMIHGGTAAFMAVLSILLLRGTGRREATA